jgi:hypothetical protein
VRLIGPRPRQQRRIRTFRLAARRSPGRRCVPRESFPDRVGHTRRHTDVPRRRFRARSWLPEPVVSELSAIGAPDGLDTCETAMTHNARQRRAPDFSIPLRECAQTSSTGHCEISRFPAESDEGGGLLNRPGSDQHLTNHAQSHAFRPKPPDCDSVLSCPDPPFADLTAAQSAAQCPGWRTSGRPRV